jgi:hypothetical protein
MRPKIIAKVRYIRIHVLFVENRLAAPFTDAHPFVPALFSASAFLSGSSFPAAFEIFHTFLPAARAIRAAFDRGTYLPLIDFRGAFRNLLFAF